jgi:excisionase family DNA binding protein
MATDTLMSGDEAAKLLGISSASFWRLVHTGRIPVVDLSGTGKTGRGRKLWKFRQSTLWAYVGSNEAAVGGAREDSPPPAVKVIGREAMAAAGWDGDSHAPKRKAKGAG